MTFTEIGFLPPARRWRRSWSRETGNGGADSARSGPTSRIRCSRSPPSGADARAGAALLWERAIRPFEDLERGGVGIMVGEFGAYRFTPHTVVLAWMRDCLENWKRAGWGWALWNFRGDFGVLDSDRPDVRYERWEGHLLDREMLELLQRFEREPRRAFGRERASLAPPGGSRALVALQRLLVDPVGPVGLAAELDRGVGHRGIVLFDPRHLGATVAFGHSVLVAVVVEGEVDAPLRYSFSTPMLSTRMRWIRVRASRLKMPKGKRCPCAARKATLRSGRRGARPRSCRRPRRRTRCRGRSPSLMSLTRSWNSSSVMGV